jgi:hypothetical protein
MTWFHTDLIKRPLFDTFSDLGDVFPRQEWFKLSKERNTDFHQLE